MEIQATLPLLSWLKDWRDPTGGVGEASKIMQPYAEEIRQQVQKQDLRGSHLTAMKMFAQMAPLMGKSPQADWYLQQTANYLLGSIVQADQGLEALVKQGQARYATPSTPSLETVPQEVQRAQETGKLPPLIPLEIGKTAKGTIVERKMPLPPVGGATQEWLGQLYQEGFITPQQFVQQSQEQGEREAVRKVISEGGMEPSQATSGKVIYKRQRGEAEGGLPPGVEGGAYKTSWAQDKEGNWTQRRTPLSPKEKAISDLDPTKKTNFLPGHSPEMLRKIAGIQSSVIMPPIESRSIEDKKSMAGALQDLLVTLPQTSFGKPGFLKMVKGKIVGGPYTPSLLADTILKQFGTEADLTFYTRYESLKARLRQFSGDAHFSNYDAQQALEALGGLGRDPSVFYESLYEQYKRLANAYNRQTKRLGELYDTADYPPFDTKQILPVYPGSASRQRQASPQQAAPPPPEDYRSLEEQLRQEYRQ